MSNIAIVTDSNSGILQAEAEKLGIYVLPMPFIINGETYFEDINLTTDEFFEKLKNDADITTSQPTPKSILDLWKKALKDHDAVVHIPMSSGLSGSCSTAAALAQSFNGKVQVVDNQRISVTLRESILDALALAEQGLSASEIKERLEAEALESSIYITVATLKYLKKGGRLTPAVAAIGTLLHIKPVLQIQGERLDTFSKVRTMAQAKTVMINAIRNDLENRFGGIDAHDAYLDIAHTDNLQEALKFKEEVMAAFPGYEVRFVDSLSLSVSCHIGAGSLAVTATKKHAG